MTKHRIAPPAALLVAALISLAPAIAAEEPASGQDTYKARLIGVPFIYYTPETKLAFGAGGVLNFRVGQGKDKTRTSSVWAYASYTLARQASVQIRPEIYLKGNRYSLSGNFRFERSPQKFYGVGNDTPTTNKESFTPQIFVAQVEVKRRLWRGLFGGLMFDFEQMTMDEIEAGGILDSGELTGSDGGMLAGLGAVLDWDTRDSVLFPRRGSFLQLSADSYGAMLGSDFSFSRLKLDLRRYLPLGSNHVLALHAYFLSTGGDVPFYKLALLGGDWLLRGYYRGRYRDKGLFLFQAEYRALITKRIGVAGFGGLGDVFPKFGDFDEVKIKLAIGTGVRYVINKRDGTTVRLDMAWGPVSFGLYATVQEAF